MDLADGDRDAGLGREGPRCWAVRQFAITGLGAWPESYQWLGNRASRAGRESGLSCILPPETRDTRAKGETAAPGPAPPGPSAEGRWGNARPREPRGTGVGHSQPDRPPRKRVPGETGSERGRLVDPTLLWVSQDPQAPVSGWPLQVLSCFSGGSKLSAMNKRCFNKSVSINKNICGIIPAQE